MNPSDDGIIITDSRNLDGVSDPLTTGKQEGMEASLRALEDQGVSIVQEKNFPQTTQVEEPRDEVSRDLLTEGGIEIMPNDDKESFL